MTTDTQPGDGRSRRWEHRRPELLFAATEYVLDHGVSTLTLRPLAAAIGVTIATVVRQFGSKDELIEEITAEINRDLLEGLANDPELTAGPAVDTLRVLWRRWLTPEETRKFSLMFELYGLALRNPEQYRWFTESVVRTWGLAPIEGALLREGADPRDAETLATLVLAIVRGLQLDYAATHDTARINAAFDAAIELVAPRRSPANDGRCP